MAAARVQTSPRPLQLDALPARQPAALDEPIELTRIERLVEGEGHDGLALAGPSADRHVADVDLPLAANGPLIPGDRDVGGRRRLPAPPPPTAMRLGTGSHVDVEPALVDPAHHAAQLFADGLDKMLLALALQRVEHGAVGLVLEDPLARELAALDLGEQLAHGVAHVLVDDARAAREVAVLGRVADAVAHAGDALLPHQVDDELELVQALEVGDLRLVARLDQGVEAGRDELGGATAEHGLLAEEVGLGLFGEQAVL